MNQVLVFDLDDTLYPERDMQYSGFRAVGRWLEKHRAVTGFAAVATSLFDRGERHTVFNRALQELGIRFDDSLISQLVDVFREHPPEINLFEDADWALTRAREDGFGLALLSDGFLVAQRNKVAALGLEGRLDRIVLTDEIGRAHWKPDPAGYQLIMDHFGDAPDRFTYIADNPHKDFVTARKLGWSTVQIRREDSEYGDVAVAPGYGADLQICSLVDLRQVFRTPV